MTHVKSHVELLADYIAGARERQLPEEVREAARLCLADWLAVAIGARNEAAGRVVREAVARWGSKGRATVIYGGTAAAPFAALANGTLAHCLDFDDTYVPAVTHTSAPVWAAVLALGQDRAVSEEAMLRAFVTGFEVAARVGGGLGQAVTQRGLHSTGVFGRIGAAAGCAALLGLDAKAAANALAAAATQAGGLVASFGTMAKPFHAGKAAMDGVLSAELAEGGFVAAPATLEPGGLDKAFIQDGAASFARPEFGGWEIRNNSFKPYAACHLVHPAVDAAREAGVAPEAIRRVRARVSPLAMQVTGGASGRPATALAAKFDLRYCIALGLNGRPVSAADFLEPWRASEPAQSLADRIDATPDADCGFATARLEIETTDGRTIVRAIPTAKGHPGNPMRWDDMGDKLDGLAAPMLGAETSDLLRLARNFGSGGTLAPLGHMLEAMRA